MREVGGEVGKLPGSLLRLKKASAGEGEVDWLIVSQRYYIIIVIAMQNFQKDAFQIR